MLFYLSMLLYIPILWRAKTSWLWSSVFYRIVTWFFGYFNDHSEVLSISTKSSQIVCLVNTHNISAYQVWLQFTEGYLSLLFSFLLFPSTTNKAKIIFKYIPAKLTFLNEKSQRHASHISPPISRLERFPVCLYVVHRRV